LTYINEESGKRVEVIEITDDNYVRFKMNGLELLVAKKRFDKVYKPVEIENKKGKLCK